MSLDVLAYVSNKTAAVNEVARVLRPHGSFVFTTWEQPGYSERLQAPQIADHRPVLEKAGFAVEVHEEPSNWQRQHRALVEGILASETELVEEIGAAAATGLVGMARGVLADLSLRRYVFVVASKR